MAPLRRGSKSALVALAALVSCLAAEEPPAPAKPNVVIILIDALRADHLSFYGYPKETAPFLARLAGQAVVFDNAFATAPSPAPSTASLFTSLYPEQHGVVTGRFGVAGGGDLLPQRISLRTLPGEVATLGEIMKKAGYRTMALADNKNVSAQMGFARGFDLFSTGDSTADGAERLNSVLRDWRGRIKEGEPYLLYLHYIDPHSPYHSRRPWFKGEERGFRESTIERYDSEIGYVDQKIEEMHRLFGWDAKTLLIVLADHGEEFWEHGGTRHGRTLYGEVLRIPLLLHDATGRLPPGRVSANVSSVDVLPTIMEYIGAPRDPRHAGVSLLSAASGRNDPALADREIFAYAASSVSPGARVDLRLAEERKAGSAEAVAGEPARANPQAYVARAILRGSWKLIADTEGSLMLFDMARDRHEQENLAAAMADVAASLRGSLDAFVDRAPRYTSMLIEEALSAEEIEKLRSLGYVQ